MSDFNKWWMDHINLSCDRGYPAPNQAAKAAWDHQQATITKLKDGKKALAKIVQSDTHKLGAAQATITELRAVLQAAFDCGMVPITSAKEGGAARFSEQVRVADRMRAALEKDGE